MNAIDTNILVYAVDTRDPAKRQQARHVIDHLHDGVLLWQVACEFVAAARKLEKHGFTRDAAWEALAGFQSVLPLVPPSPHTLRLARELHVEHRMSFWDAMIVAGCLACGATRLYSEDLPGKPVQGVEIINPFET